MKNDNKPQDKKIASPENAYGTPHAVLRDDSLSKKEKIKTLENWEDEQKALLRADDENMGTQVPQVPPAQKLGIIQHAERVAAGNKEQIADDKRLSK